MFVRGKSFRVILKSYDNFIINILRCVKKKLAERNNVA